MSGGHFNYIQYKLEDISRELENIIVENDSDELDEYGEKIGRDYSEETLDEFMNAIVFLKLCEIYVQRIDYLLSGDDGEDSFHSNLRKDIDEENE
jgi:tetrahydromethanopterin S-methyltransferase subunit G